MPKKQNKQVATEDTDDHVRDAFIDYLKGAGWMLKTTKDRMELSNCLDGTVLNYHSILGLFGQWVNRNNRTVDSDTQYDPSWWYKLNGRLPFVTRDIFRPAFEPEMFVPLASGTLAVNTYKRFRADEAANNFDPNPAPWLEYLERMFPVIEDRDIVCGWLAHMFQHPDQRPSWHLLFSGDTGTGKGYLFDKILSPLLCKQTASVSSFSQVTEKHNQLFTKNMLVHMDDMYTTNSNQMNKLKSILSEENVTVRPLYETERTERVYARVIFSSNKVCPLKLEDNERRWYAPAFMVHRVSRDETHAFVRDTLIPWVDSGGLNVIHEWLLRRNLQNFNHKYVSQSSTLKQMINNSVSVLEQELDSWLSATPVFKLKAIQQAFPGKHQAIADLLTERGYGKCQPFQNVPYPVTGVTSKVVWWRPNSYTTGDVRNYLQQECMPAAHDLSSPPF
ncbi:primase-helicase family protein [Serratia plymuthica]|uniref:primase-helicase family protein n=1 Tax=Serratia plymuthica TaxID=82996 RepID=UPI001249560B|nr:primase-helicase family protein [Serratia plymuthica]